MAFGYVMAAVCFVIAHASVSLARPLIGPAIFTLFLAAVVIVALYGGLGPALLTTVLSSLDLAYTFMPPYNAFEIDFAGFLYLGTFMTVALLTSSLQAHRRRAEESLRTAHDVLEERVRARTEELSRSQAQLSSLVNGIIDQAFFMLDAQGRISSWNAGAQRLLGYSASDIVGEELSHIWPQSGSTASIGTVNSAAFVHRPDERFEYLDWVVHRSGMRIWAGIILAPAQDADQRPRGITVALRDLTERKSLEREILEISEREQQRIGHDLHDGLGQELTGIALLSTALAMKLNGSDVGVARDAEQIADLVHEAIRHTRELARGLCPIDLEGQGLIPALARLAEYLSRVPNLKCSFDASPNIDIESDVATHLYRIAQEAVNNAARHGKASCIDVRLAQNGGRLILTVTDDGIGIPGVRGGSGMGLHLMNYRAKAIHGWLDIRRLEPHGTQVKCIIEPMNKAFHG